MRNPTTGSWVENGSTRLKSRLLEARGWRVLRVPFFEWNRLATRERGRYLEDMLEVAHMSSTQEDGCL
eukprot:CAMPEP_0197427898 /NCGR_PEP_ID=MMETSP1170-20131217/39654_1 /TAXON_ID=54406 /ORGANISM="Sarcinochrysis sp, Strain CCMP770" /LENGTH=67 /DNA_ID=CAMNT_0042955617 /DNA_START=11 /DNA_END=211 /DNA_ORIENTATION=+